MNVGKIKSGYSPQELAAMRNRSYRFPDLDLSPDEVVTLRLLLDSTTPSAGHSCIPERQRQIEILKKILASAVERK